MSTLDEYANLLAEVDAWFDSCLMHHPEQITCAKGCSGCCRGLFDITLLDAALLKRGFEHLSAGVKETLTLKAKERIKAIQALWPEFEQPFILNSRNEDEIEELMASDNETSCLLLDENGRCILYEYRPMTCRLHGLPLVDVSGEVMESEWCTLNFTGIDPLRLDRLKWRFREIFRMEGALGRAFTKELTGAECDELDTFIAAALLIDFEGD